MTAVVEIRTYRLRPCCGAAFHRTVVEESVPMLQRWGVDVVAFGPSLHADDSYYLIRWYASLEERQRSQDAFYGSDEWRHGPREGIVSRIERATARSCFRPTRCCLTAPDTASRMLGLVRRRSGPPKTKLTNRRIADHVEELALKALDFRPTFSSFPCCC